MLQHWASEDEFYIGNLYIEAVMFTHCSFYICIGKKKYDIGGCMQKHLEHLQNDV